jgi:hypothetical protein
MGFNNAKFRKDIIQRLLKSNRYFADISDIANDFIGNNHQIRHEVVNELISLSRDKKILEIKEWEPDSGKMNRDWWGNIKDYSINRGEKVEGLHALLTSEFFAARLQRRIWRVGITMGIIAVLVPLLLWIIDKLSKS